MTKTTYLCDLCGNEEAAHAWMFVFPIKETNSETEKLFVIYLQTSSDSNHICRACLTSELSNPAIDLQKD